MKHWLRVLVEFAAFALCRHVWILDLGRLTPVGMRAEKCDKCWAKRTVYSDIVG